MNKTALPKQIRPVFKGGSYFTAPDLALAVRRHSNHASTIMHRHTFTELVVITGGSAIHCTDEVEHPISRGDVFVISGNRSHGYREGVSLSLFNIMFDLDQLGIPFKDLETIPGYHTLFKLEPVLRARHSFKSRLRLSTGNLTEVESFIETMERELEKRPPGYQLMATALLMRLIVYLSRCYTQSPDKDCHAFIRIAKAIDYLESQYNQYITLSQLADTVHMSVRHFQRAFWRVMGTSPIDFLVRLRITHAVELLQQEKDLNITEIAYRVGFQDSNYFTRQFHKIIGYSPRKFRLHGAQ